MRYLAAFVFAFLSIAPTRAQEIAFGVVRHRLLIPIEVNRWKGEVIDGAHDAAVDDLSSIPEGERVTVLMNDNSKRELVTANYD